MLPTGGGEGNCANCLLSLGHAIIVRLHYCNLKCCEKDWSFHRFVCLFACLGRVNHMYIVLLHIYILDVHVFYNSHCVIVSY